jgi:hypothetical protein
MATTKLQSGAVVEGLNETLRALSRIDKAAQAAVRDEVQKVADVLAREIAEAGNRETTRDAWVASSIRSGRDRLPVVKVGSAKRMPVSRRGQGPRASDLMFGMEFGSKGGTDNPTVRGGAPGWRFPAETPKKKRGNQGRWIYPTLVRQQPRVVDLWAQALEKVAAEWTR